MSLNFITNKYRILGKKGEGTFSDVLKCQNVADGSFAACKKMKQHYESMDQVNNLREIQAMRRLSPHPNILELIEVLFDKKSGTLVLICELMDMNIYELIRGRRHYLADQKIKNYMYQLCKSVEHMHRNGIFHRDVKPENILIKDDLLKLADFGSCRSVYSKQPYTEYISTRWYRAPECLLTDGFYTYKMDIWSVGCVMFEILSLHPLFPGSNEVDQIAKIHDVMGTPDPSVISRLRNKTRGMNFNFPAKKGTGIEKMLPHVTSECIDLIYQLCRYDPDERLTAKQALRHQYFKELRDAEKKATQLARARKEKERQEKERKEREAKETVDDQSDKNKENEGTESTENMGSEIRKKPKKDRSKDRENNLREINNKYKLDPVEKLNKENEEETKSTRKTKSPTRPDSGSSSINHSVRYPASILHNRDPVYGYHKKQKEKAKPSLQQIPTKLNDAYSTKMNEAYLNPYIPQLNYFERKKYWKSEVERDERRKSRLAESSPTPFGNSFLPKVTTVQKPNTFQPTFTSSYGQTQLPKLGATSTYLPQLTQAFVAKPAKASKPQATTKSIYGHYQLPSIDRRAGNY